MGSHLEDAWRAGRQEWARAVYIHSLQQGFSAEQAEEQARVASAFRMEVVGGRLMDALPSRPYEPRAQPIYRAQAEVLRDCEELLEQIQLSRWAANPAVYAEEALGVRPWDLVRERHTQRALLESVSWATRVSVRAGHKTGQTTSAVCIALWAYTTLPGARVVLTAPTAASQNVLWRELLDRVRNARVPIAGKVHPELDTWLRAAAPDGEPIVGLWDQRGDRQVLGFPPSSADLFAGVSGENLVFVVDGAADVDPRVLEAIEGQHAGGARVVMLGNPTRARGEFHESHSSKANLYTTFHFDSARVAYEVNPTGEVPGLATPAWVQACREDWGVFSDVFAVRVSGDFPALDHPGEAARLAEDR